MEFAAIASCFLEATIEHAAEVFRMVTQEPAVNHEDLPSRLGAHNNSHDLVVNMSIFVSWSETLPDTNKTERCEDSRGKFGSDVRAWNGVQVQYSFL